MILAARVLILWIVVGSFIGTIAIEENVGTTTALVESQNLTTTSTTTMAAPTTTTTSTTPRTTTASSTSPTISSEATTSSSASTPPILARANPISSTSTIRSITSTTSTATTTKPSAKRQLSLSEFQQLVAKVNDEISMLRKQSANLSQTYEELVRRYNNRTSQVPIVLYDVSECSNSTTGKEETSTKAIRASSIVPEATKPTVSSESTTTTAKTTTVTTSTTNAPSSTMSVEYTTQKQPHLESDGVASVESVEPKNTGNSHTQIYGNKYYNYIHYFMYPPSGEQLEEIAPPPQINQRRKSGNDSRKPAPPTRRKNVPYQNNRWEERPNLREESDEPEYSPDLRRWPLEPTGELSGNLREGPTDYRQFFGNPIPAIGGQYRFGGALQRKPIELPAAPVAAVPKIPPYPFVEDRIPSRVVPQENIFAPSLERQKLYPFAEDRIPSRIVPVEKIYAPAREKLTQPETLPKAPAYQADKNPSFLERLNVNRNGPPTLRTTKAPIRLFTPSTPAARQPVSAQSIENMFSFGAKPVNYSIPTTAKPLAGIVRNGWDGYDFSFVRKAQEKKKRLQREQRSSRKSVRDL